MNWDFDLTGVRVMLGMPAHRDIPARTVMSLVSSLAVVLKQTNIHFDIEIQEGSSLVHHARSIEAWRFLQTNCNRLFWIDSDIVWSPDGFLRLIALSTKMDVVTGVYPAKQDPLIFHVSTDNGTIRRNEWGCFPIHGQGLGFTIVTRRVIEELAAKAPQVKFPNINNGEPIPHIFRCDDTDGYARGEDMAFFADVRALGYSVNLDPTIQLGHVGPKVFSGSIMDHLTKVQGE